MPLVLASNRSSLPIGVAAQAIEPGAVTRYNTNRTPLAGPLVSMLTRYQRESQLSTRVFPSKESGIRGAPAAGVGSGLANPSTARRIDDANTVSTMAILELRGRGLGGPVNSAHATVIAAAVMPARGIARESRTRTSSQSRWTTRRMCAYTPEIGAGFCDGCLDSSRCDSATRPTNQLGFSSPSHDNAAAFTGIETWRVCRGCPPPVSAGGDRDRSGRASLLSGDAPIDRPA